MELLLDAKLLIKFLSNSALAIFFSNFSNTPYMASLNEAVGPGVLQTCSTCAVKPQ